MQERGLNGPTAPCHRSLGQSGAPPQEWAGVKELQSEGLPHRMILRVTHPNHPVRHPQHFIKLGYSEDCTGARRGSRELLSQNSSSASSAFFCENRVKRLPPMSHCWQTDGPDRMLRFVGNGRSSRREGSTLKLTPPNRVHRLSRSGAVFPVEVRMSEAAFHGIIMRNLPIRRSEIHSRGPQRI